MKSDALFFHLLVDRLEIKILSKGGFIPTHNFEQKIDSEDVQQIARFNSYADIPRVIAEAKQMWQELKRKSESRENIWYSNPRLVILEGIPLFSEAHRQPSLGFGKDFLEDIWGLQTSYVLRIRYKRWKYGEVGGWPNKYRISSDGFVFESKDYPLIVPAGKDERALQQALLLAKEKLVEIEQQEEKEHKYHNYPELYWIIDKEISPLLLIVREIRLVVVIV